jgi:methylmalonyl-CoA mutase N-terminal domain/subunit
VEAAQKIGLEIDKFANQLSFFFACHNNFLEEVAKFRAARRIWARLVKNRFSSQNSRSQRLRFHTQTCGSTLTAQQPENNIVRTTIQALAAVFGGTQSLHTNSMDEALSLPSEKAVQIALRTQQIIAYESGVADSVDPLAGSYLVEHLTDEIEKSVMDYLRKIKDMGGALEAIEHGYIQHEIQESAYVSQKAIEKNEEVIVGVNAYEKEETIDMATISVDPEVEAIRCDKLKNLRDGRDMEKTRKELDRLENAACGSDNMMPVLIECVENDITLGEICGRLRQVWGEYQPPVWG